MANQNQKPATGEQWDAAQIEQALQRLNDIHLQLRKLRSAIPRMMEPMAFASSTPPPSSSSPQAIVSGMRQSTKATYREIREYKQSATDEETTKVLERAKHSRKEDPKGIRPWRAKDDPNWSASNT